MKEESSLDGRKHTGNITEHFKNNKDGIILLLFIFFFNILFETVWGTYHNLSYLFIDELSERHIHKSSPGGPRR